jgi:hypothetical protein
VLLFLFLHLPAWPQLGHCRAPRRFRFDNQSRIAGVCREISLCRLLELTLRVGVAGRAPCSPLHDHILRCTQQGDCPACAAIAAGSGQSNDMIRAVDLYDAKPILSESPQPRTDARQQIDRPRRTANAHETDDAH